MKIDVRPKKIKELTKDVILLEMANAEDKKLVMSNKHKLKIASTGIYIIYIYIMT